MITFMSNMICVTNRRLCNIEFLDQVEKIMKAKPAAVLLREKDLQEEEYKELAKAVLEMEKTYHTPCILHTFYKTAKELKAKSIHLPMRILRSLSKEEREEFKILGSSCHSVEEAMEAEKLGCTYIFAGHVFATDCKKGLEPRGLTFLQEVCQSVKIPVYGIGGISPENIREVEEAGAKGGCIMSSAMKAEDVTAYLEEFEHGI